MPCYRTGNAVFAPRVEGIVRGDSVASPSCRLDATQIGSIAGPWNSIPKVGSRRYSLKSAFHRCHGAIAPATRDSPIRADISPQVAAAAARLRTMVTIADSRRLMRRKYIDSSPEESRYHSLMFIATPLWAPFSLLPYPIRDDLLHFGTWFANERTSERATAVLLSAGNDLDPPSGGLVGLL